METNRRLEFFSSPDDRVCFSISGEGVRFLEESEKDVISEIITYITTFYPKAYEALASKYRKKSINKSYYNYLIAHRFVRCNLLLNDSLKWDIENGHMNLEKVPCPMRGECPLEGIVCMPKFRSALSSREREIIKLMAKGYTTEKIAAILYISPMTVRNHLANARIRTGKTNSYELISEYSKYEDND